MVDFRDHRNGRFLWSLTSVADAVLTGSELYWRDAEAATKPRRRADDEIARRVLPDPVR